MYKLFFLFKRKILDIANKTLPTLVKYDPTTNFFVKNPDNLDNSPDE